MIDGGVKVEETDSDVVNVDITRKSKRWCLVHTQLRAVSGNLEFVPLLWGNIDVARTRRSTKKKRILYLEVLTFYLRVIHDFTTICPFRNEYAL